MTAQHVTTWRRCESSSWTARIRQSTESNKRNGLAAPRTENDARRRHSEADQDSGRERPLEKKREYQVAWESPSVARPDHGLSRRRLTVCAGIFFLSLSGRTLDWRRANDLCLVLRRHAPLQHCPSGGAGRLLSVPRDRTRHPNQDRFTPVFRSRWWHEKKTTLPPARKRKFPTSEEHCCLLPEPPSPPSPSPCKSRCQL